MIVCFVWLFAVGVGFAVITDYQNAGGQIGATLKHWPAASQIVLDRTHPTLIMFAHPKCPCTRASMEELNRLLANCKEMPATQVWFLKPRGFPVDWTRAGLWHQAEAIPGTTVHEDIDGAEAFLFGAETSGYVLLYDTKGVLLFKGGITDSRGHAGDNAGENAIISVLGGKTADLRQTRVYGCPLENREPLSEKATE